MKNYSELKAAVARANTPKEKTGTFVTGLLDIAVANKNNPQAIQQFVDEVRENQTSLIHDLTTV